MSAFNGRIAVVTGATSGIGRELAIALGKRGDRVVGIGRNPTRLQSLREDLGPGHFVLGLDVASEADMIELSEFLKTLGKVNLLIASAVLGRVGGESTLPPRARDLPLSDWLAMVDVNLHGVFLANQAVLPLMRQAEDGDIVNIGSAITPHGQKGQALAMAYSATKFALTAYGHALAEEMSAEGIRVRTILPGTVDTPLIAGTALGASFGGSISPQNFATALLGLIDLGQDVWVPDPHILPSPRSLSGTGT